MNLIPKFKPFKREQSESDFKIHYNEQTCMIRLTKSIEPFISKMGERPLVVCCIGTDRSTGDSLGPLIGTRLKRSHLEELHVYGTLDSPVHAVNLSETYKEIKHTFTNPFIIGIDACLGRYNNVGMISLGEGPVLPGAGVHKDLPPIGDIHLTGTVNVGGYMEYFVLQNTRLHLVMSMADVMSVSLISAIRHLKHRTPSTKVNLHRIEH